MIKFFLILFSFSISKAFLISSNSCKYSNVSPIKNFDTKSLLGIWYNFASSSNLDDANKKCFKTYFKSVFNGSLIYDQSFVE